MAREAMETNDFYDAKTMLLSAGILHQIKVSRFDAIAVFMDENDCADESFEDSLSQTLPFCSDAYKATKTPDAMREYLEELNTEELKSKLSSAEPLIDIIFKNGATERKLQSVNSLISLNILLSHHGEIPKITNVRVKHNGTRLFLSSSGRKSLADLGIVSDDVVEIEDIDSTSSNNCADITSMTINAQNNQGSATTNTSKRSKLRGKKKGKGKR